MLNSIYINSKINIQKFCDWVVSGLSDTAVVQSCKTAEPYLIFHIHLNTFKPETLCIPAPLNQMHQIFNMLGSILFSNVFMSHMLVRVVCMHTCNLKSLCNCNNY